MRYTHRSLFGLVSLLCLVTPGIAGDRWGRSSLESPGRTITVEAIVVDGSYDDWDGLEPIHVDPSGDGGASGIDFGPLWVADDTRFLYLRIPMGEEIGLNENNNLTLYLDTDASSSTGLSVMGIGAELEWRFGDRAGTFYRGGQSPGVSHDDIRFRALPTVTANQFEIAIGRQSLPDGQHPLFLGTNIRIAFQDLGGDELPNAGETLAYTLDQGNEPSPIAHPLDRDSTNDVRFISYNVLQDSPWESGNEPRFGRQLAALQPDVINFQEIYNHSPIEVAALVGRWVDPEPGDVWYASGNNDCITVSRYPIIDSWPLDGNLATLLDLDSVWSTEVLVVNAHLPCCSNDSGRQEEIDRILWFVRESKEPGGLLDLEVNSPTVIVGDMNLVGLASVRDALITGNISNQSTWGEDFAPDWDGTDLTSLIPRLTETPLAYSWRSDGSSFWPGHLDYIIYTDSVIELGNYYALYTPLMSSGTLTEHGLLASDSEASDHLLFCADFDFTASTDVEPPSQPGQSTISEIDLWPNPGPDPDRGITWISLNLAKPGTIRLEIFDASGRIVALPMGPEFVSLPADTWGFGWDGRGLGGEEVAPGVYYARIRGQVGFDRSFESTKKLIWIR